MHNKSKLAREIIEAERHPPHRKPPAKPREKIVEEAGQHLRTLHSQAPSGTREWNIASVDYRLQSLDRQTLGKIRERNIAAANAHFAFPLSFAGPYSGVGDEEVTDYDIASVFGEESNPVSVGKALAQGAEYAEKSDQGKVTSIFTEAQRALAEHEGEGLLQPDEALDRRQASAQVGRCRPAWDEDHCVVLFVPAALAAFRYFRRESCKKRYFFLPDGLVGPAEPEAMREDRRSCCPSVQPPAMIELLEGGDHAGGLAGVAYNG